MQYDEERKLASELRLQRSRVLDQLRFLNEQSELLLRQINHLESRRRISTMPRNILGQSTKKGA
jgi:hypothetical protein